jgi:hypothetical protein
MKYVYSMFLDIMGMFQELIVKIFWESLIRNAVKLPSAIETQRVMICLQILDSVRYPEMSFKIRTSGGLVCSNF